MVLQASGCGPVPNGWLYYGEVVMNGTSEERMTRRARDDCHRRMLEKFNHGGPSAREWRDRYCMRDKGFTRK